jgi:hypothetical protein
MEPSYRLVAEETMMQYKFPELLPGQSAKNWGEYIIIEANKLSFGPCKLSCQ